MRSSFCNILYIFRLAWKCCSDFVISVLFNGMMMGIAGTVPIMFISIFYGLLERKASFLNTALLIGAMLALTVLIQLWMQFFSNVIKPSKSQVMQYRLNRMLYEKSVTLDLSCYDNPEYYDHFVWAMNECHKQTVKMLSATADWIQHSIAFLTSSAVMATIDPILACIAVTASILHIVLHRKWNKMNMERNQALTPLSRKSSYYESVFSTPDYAKELRTSEAADVILEKYCDNLKTIKDTHIAFNNHILGVSIPFNLLSGLMQPIVYCVLFYQALISKTVDITGFAVASSAFWSLRYRIQGFVNILTGLQKQALYIDRVRAFMEYEPKLRGGLLKPEDFESLELKNVSFGYSHDRQVLHGINLSVCRGEKIAFVGYNGAGKTTLTNLILRLYDPDYGEILYNGKNIRDMELSYRRKYAVVLQDFCIFALPLVENVLYRSYSEKECGQVASALSDVGLDSQAEMFPDGVQTELTKEFRQDGVVLSGGQWQKLAISRIFASDSELIIMDEPSSALDPEAEYEINRNLAKFAVSKTVITISHRLSTTRHADCIYMFEDGRIIESGTHEELMQIGGKYAEMFRVQAEKFD